MQSHQLVTAFDTDGTRQWSFNVRDARGRPLAADGQHVYVSAGNAVYAVDWNGEMSWTHESDGEPVGAPTVAGDTVLFRSEGQLTALSRATGEERWTTTPGGVGRAIVTPAAIFVPESDGAVVALGET
ncbi:PQQ-binding-like beta-propeller repeat protein [Haloferax prahovense]|uniref:outer membrane protein assembly factor BamB family protein n=1 Tax=Haloferax prahovense TaxID=381852 RepID=UPI003C76926F